MAYPALSLRIIRAHSARYTCYRGAVNYILNDLGQRVRKIHKGDVRHFVYDEQGQFLGEYGRQGAALQETVYLGAIPVAVLEGPQTHFIHADHLNTPRAISDSTNTVIWRWDSDPFGATQAHEDPDNNGVTFTYNPRFPGQYYDHETGLHYNYFRDYDPSTGRYGQSDPIGLRGGLNVYAYVGNNPLTHIDPAGLDWSYQQSTGNLYHQPPASQGGGPPAPVASGGYSGKGAGYNNSNMQNVPRVGPIPQGGWTIDTPYNSPNVGPFAIPLTPNSGTNTFGRTDFRIHGDNSCKCGSASEGCVIFNRDVRNKIINRGDPNFIVVP